MPILSIMRDWGTNPAAVRITTSDSLSAVTTSNYLLSQASVISSLNNGTWEWVVGDLVAVSASDGDNIFRFNGNDFSTLIDLPSGTVTGFVELNPSGNQSIANHNLTLDAGSFIAGLPGVSGNFISHIGTEMGALSFGAAPGIGSNNIIILNAAFGQTSIIYITDPGNLFGVFLVAATTTPFVSGNLLEASGTKGLVIDSGIAASSVLAAGGIGLVTYQDITINFSDLASGGNLFVVPAITGQSFRVRSMMVNQSAGMAGGDQNIILEDGNGIIIELDSTLVQTPVNTVYAGTGMTLFGEANRQTGIGNGLFFAYFGGSTDYTSGSIDVTVCYERVT